MEERKLIDKLKEAKNRIDKGEYLTEEEFFKKDKLKEGKD